MIINPDATQYTCLFMLLVSANQQDPTLLWTSSRLRCLVPWLAFLWCYSLPHNLVSAVEGTSLSYSGSLIKSAVTVHASPSDTLRQLWFTFVSDLQVFICYLMYQWLTIRSMLSLGGFMLLSCSLHVCGMQGSRFWSCHPVTSYGSRMSTFELTFILRVWYTPIQHQPLISCIYFYI
jgi:hypothetical protein